MLNLGMTSVESQCQLQYIEEVKTVEDHDCDHERWMSHLIGSTDDRPAWPFLRVCTLQRANRDEGPNQRQSCVTTKALAASIFCPS